MTRLLLLLLLAGHAATAAVVPRDTVAGPPLARLSIVDEKGRPLFGVYVIDAREARLLATSGPGGECPLATGELRDHDTLRFHATGYHVRQHAWGDLRRSPRVVMRELTYHLDEVVVAAPPRRGPSLAPEALLQRVADKLGRKLPRSTPPYCNFAGEARYEKITAYRRRVVEYRREMGHYFTSGDVVPRDAWDSRFRAYFVPARSARSRNLAANGEDLLDPVYVTTDEERFDAGTRKVFTLLRALQLHGPLFAGTKNHEFTLVEGNTARFLYAFQTQPGAYPDRTRVTCRGTLSIDRERLELDTMTLDYIDYQHYRGLLLGARASDDSPFTTRAVITFARDADGRTRVASCHQETRWKYNPGDGYAIVELPSRPAPARGELVEREAFLLVDYRPLPARLRDQATTARIHAVQRNPAAPHDSTLFLRLAPLLPDSAAVADLSRREPLDAQFRDNSGRYYYPEHPRNGFNGVTRQDDAFREELDVARRKLFELFPFPAAGPRGATP
jgi:hypothetical protein